MHVSISLLKITLVYIVLMLASSSSSIALETMNALLIHSKGIATMTMWQLLK
jgi:hypothetical protein